MTVEREKYQEEAVSVNAASRLGEEKPTLRFVVRDHLLEVKTSPLRP